MSHIFEQLPIRLLRTGLATFVPGLDKVHLRRKKAKGAKQRSAEHSYGVWLRHMITAHRNGLWNSPKHLAEIGPGASFGIGIAALLSGVEQYSALDVLPFSSNDYNAKLLSEMIELFRRRADLPENPGLVPSLQSHAFPIDLLPEAQLRESLSEERIARISESLANVNGNSSMFRYICPWTDSSVIERGAVDMVISLAVMEHVNDPVAVYRASFEWLRSGGLASHRIDYSCHRTAKKDWNGHFVYPDLLWKAIVGRRPFLLNRYGHSAHVQAMRSVGFERLWEETREQISGLTPGDRASDLRTVSDTDFSISGGAIQAVKP